MPDVSALSLYNIAGTMLTNPKVFHKYYTMNHVLRDNMPHCGGLCKRVHHCASLQVDYNDYDDCIARALMASSANRSATGLPRVPSISDALFLAAWSVVIVASRT